MKTDRKTGLTVFMQHLGGVKETAVLEKSYDVSITDDKLPRNQLPSLEGIKVVLDTLGDRGKEARPMDFVNLRFIKKLEDSGFILQLYRKKLSIAVSDGAYVWSSNARIDRRAACGESGRMWFGVVLPDTLRTAYIRPFTRHRLPQRKPSPLDWPGRR